MFFYCENRKQYPGAGFILYTLAPFYMAKVIRFESKRDMQEHLEQNHYSTVSRPAGYNILIVPFSQLQKEKPDRSLNNQAEIFKQMADFYYVEKIKPSESYFKKWLTIKKPKL